MNVTTSTGVKIEPYNSSRVELHLGPRYRFYKELMFAFEFRTDSANGTLFYGRSEAYPEEFVALVLRNGRPVHKIQCPSLHADITLPSTIFPPLNDNRWHRVIYSTRLGRFGYNGIIDVDGTNHTSVYEVNCEDFDTVIFGGHRPTHVGTLLPAEMTDHGSFEGCMKEAYFPYPFSSPGGYYVVSQCD
ncbi:hypothetical protein EGW08_022069 [Elysia chlorotica]|uniref:Laminin G domain-containing protein n=1 Tax=Elysia chlorotica TaxID=188477 RepID=A0A433SLW5_ELYCH|nr:hypothetical protein EGW08_022069 [Elysia chlorotica]